jgi:predicted nucleic acid-binding protein
LKILFDTNVILDMLLNRFPHASNAVDLVSMVEQNVIQGFLCATTITTIDYLCTKAIGKDLARNAINQLLELFLIAEVNQTVLKNAANSNFSDFEDALLYQSGIYIKINGLVTRNVKDFKFAEYSIYTPQELLHFIKAQ